MTFHVVVMVLYEKLPTYGGNGSYFFSLTTSFLKHLIHFVIHFHRNAGMGNGLHGLQIQIAMRGTVSMENGFFFFSSIRFEVNIG